MLYCITPKGKKYHFTKNCRTLVRSKVIKEIDLSKIDNLVRFAAKGEDDEIL